MIDEQLELTKSNPHLVYCYLFGSSLFTAPYNHRADSEKEAVALDVEEPVEVEWPSRGLRFVSTKTGIVGCKCSTKLLV